MRSNGAWTIVLVVVIGRASAGPVDYRRQISIPAEWLAGGKAIEVRGAPTSLGGPISFRVRGAVEHRLVTVTVTQAPSRASAFRVNLPGTHVLKVDRAVPKGASVGHDYVEVPARKGTYRIRVGLAPNT